MKWFPVLVAVWLIQATSASAAGIIPDTIVSAALDDCSSILRQELRLDDKTGLAARGYEIEPADDEGLWASKAVGEGRLRIGIGPGKPGCRLRYHGFRANVVFDAVVQELINQGFEPADADAKNTDNVVLRTLAKSDGPIGIASMFRLNVSPSTDFAMTLFPPLSRRKD